MSNQPDTRMLVENQSYMDKETHRFAHHAMATLFEIRIQHPDYDYAEKAAQAGFNEIDRLEQVWSRYIENSEIAKINALKQFEKIMISEDTRDCLLSGYEIYQSTKGAFDISAGPVIDLWKNKDSASAAPSKEAIDSARLLTGLPWLRISESGFEVELMHSKINLDLGGFGKGYALDKVGELLEDWDLPSFLIHSGYSTILAGGVKKNLTKWPLSITNPATKQTLFEALTLSAEALSGSGLEKGKHIIDPRTGYPVNHHLAAWAQASSAGVSDALSTAFMIMNHDEVDNFCADHPEISAITITNEEKQKICKFGLWNT